MTALDVSGLDVRYGKSHVIFDLGLQVEAGQLLALLGRNGAGKTTTIAAIVGLLPGASGRIVVEGQDLSRAPSYRRTQGRIAYVPSGARCFPNLTVAENLHLTERSRAAGGWDLARVYELFPKLGQLQAGMAGGLSGGERQMLAVGRALMSNPTVMLLDEPTEGLAPVVVQSLAHLLTDLKSTGMAILLAEQNHRLALRVADRAAFIEKGSIVDELPASEAAASPVLHRVLGI
ncbi:MAG: ABC transporter ATP-binding protein [Candidatus Dormibacteraeota bacterium]|nr:ABC transporter ATP-binding protein [Candidatus Dormibacteraeota bacterium]